MVGTPGPLACNQSMGLKLSLKGPWRFSNFFDIQLLLSLLFLKRRCAACAEAGVLDSWLLSPASTGTLAACSAGYPAGVCLNLYIHISAIHLLLAMSRIFIVTAAFAPASTDSISVAPFPNVHGHRHQLVCMLAPWQQPPAAEQPATLNLHRPGPPRPKLHLHRCCLLSACFHLPNVPNVEKKSVQIFVTHVPPPDTTSLLQQRQPGRTSPLSAPCRQPEAGSARQGQLLPASTASSSTTRYPLANILCAGGSR